MTEVTDVLDPSLAALEMIEKDGFSPSETLTLRKWRRAVAELRGGLQCDGQSAVGFVTTALLVNGPHVRKTLSTSPHAPAPDPHSRSRAHARICARRHTHARKSAHARAQVVTMIRFEPRHFGPTCCGEDTIEGAFYGALNVTLALVGGSLRTSLR